MAVPCCSSIFSDVDTNWLMHMENGVSKKDPSKTRQSIFPYLQIKPCGVRYRSGKNCSSQHGNDSTHLVRSSLLRVDSTFGALFNI